MQRANEDRMVGAIVAGKYVVRRIVGSGSMGVVCEAEHIEIGKRVAIKVIEASLTGVGDIALRFRQEARAASLVESQHIVQVFDVGTDDKLGLYLVMEYLTGEDLQALLSREGRLSVDRAVRIAVQASRGLAKAHGVGVIHRDLKPANIFLCDRDDGDEPLVKVLDFGISKVIAASWSQPPPDPRSRQLVRGAEPGDSPSHPAGALRLTRAGMVVGTPQYMSPEQAQGFPVDERTDVWAMGLVLYEMLAGRPAYPELPTYEQFIVHLVSHPPDSLRQVAPDIPEKLAEVVHQALEHRLDHRIAGCAELARRLLDAHAVQGSRASGIEVAAGPADTWADPSMLSPYATPDAADDPPASLTIVMPSNPSESSISIDVPPATPGPSPAPASSSHSRSARKPLASPDPLDDEEDAPQFFDRGSLKPVGLSRAASEGARLTASSGSRSRARRLAPVAALVLLALALALAAALALR